MSDVGAMTLVSASALFVDSCSEASVVDQVRVSPTLPASSAKSPPEPDAPLPLPETSVPGAEATQLPSADWHWLMLVEGTGSVVMP